VDRSLRAGVALTAIIVPLVYWLSELVETIQGGDFTTFRLVLTYVGEAGLPFAVLGVIAVAATTTSSSVVRTVTAALPALVLIGLGLETLPSPSHRRVR
jgi:hypothetical protein